MLDDIKYFGKNLKNVAASIDLAFFDRDLGVTVSGSTNIPQIVFDQPQEERDKNASQLLIQKEDSLKTANIELTEAVHKVLENPGSSESLQKGNTIVIMNSNFYGSALGGDVQKANMIFHNEWNQIKNDIDITKLRTEIEEAIIKIQAKAEAANHYDDLSNLMFARDQLSQADGSSMLKYLHKIGDFGLDMIKGMGANLLLMLMTGG